MNLKTLSSAAVLTLFANAFMSLTYAEGQNGISITPGTITKWAGKDGSLTDSVIHEDPDTGKVGIGTAEPNGRLTITQDGPATQVFENLKNDNHEVLIGVDTSAILSAITASDLQLRTNNINRMVIKAGTGDIAIGTTTPIARLDVRTDSDRAVYAESTDSFVGIGVEGAGRTEGGFFSSSDGTGVGGNGRTGVDGYSAFFNGIGVKGFATAGSNAYGVWGLSQPGYAGYFNGRVSVTARFDSPDKHFKIDHPLDPANKYMVHASVESAERMNIYNGMVTLDGFGEATVTLPEWFDALNRDFCYQLTSVGSFAPVYVAEEISDNQFKIAGGNPGGKVSWQVTGVRHDAYANANPMEVEEAKPDSEKGYYLHPKLFGQPEEKGIEWAHHPEMMRQMKAAQQK